MIARASGACTTRRLVAELRDFAATTSRTGRGGEVSAKDKSGRAVEGTGRGSVHEQEMGSAERHEQRVLAVRSS